MAGAKTMKAVISIAGRLEPSLGQTISRTTSMMGGLGKAFGGAAGIAGRFGSVIVGAAGTALKMTATAMTAAAGAVAAFGVSATKTGMEFESAMSQVQATMLLDKSTAEGLASYQKLEEAAREMGRATAFSATEAAEALNYLALAGYNADQAAAALPTVLRLAGAGAMDLAAASDMVTDSMAALGIAATQTNLEAFADRMALTASRSNTSVQQLGEAILAVGGTAAQLKGGTVELDAALGILADSGIKAAEGGTHLRNLITKLQDPRNKKAAEVFERLHLSAYDLATGEMRSLGDIFGDINKALDGLKTSEANKIISTIFKETDLAAARAMLAATTDSLTGLERVLDSTLSESGKSVESLGIDLEAMAKTFDATAKQEEFAARMMTEYGLSAEQSGVLFNGLSSIVSGTGNRFQELTAAIEDSRGAAEKMYGIQLDNLKGDIDILSSAFTDLKLSVYGAGNEAFRGLAQYGTEQINRLSAAMQSGGFSSLAAELGSVLSEAIGQIASKAPELVNMASALLDSLLNGISAKAPEIGRGLADLAATAAEAIVTTAPRLYTVAGQLGLEFVKGIAENLPEMGEALFEGLSSAGDALKGFFENGFQEMIALEADLVSGIPAAIQGSGTAIVDAFASIFSGIGGALPSFGSIATSMIEAMKAGITEMTSVGVSMIDGIASGLAQGIPNMLSNVMPMIVEFTENLRTNAGLLVDSGLNMVVQLAQGIANSLPVLIENIPAIVTNIAGIINDNAPKVLIAGGQILFTLARGIIQAIPTLIANIPQILYAIWNAFTAFNWINLGATIINSIKTGLTQMGAAIPNHLREIGTKAVEFFKSVNWANVGRVVINDLKASIMGGARLIPDILKNAGTAALNAFKSIDWLGLGKAVVQGIIDGIGGMGAALKTTITSLGGKAVEWAKGKLKINSPSKVFRDEVGVSIPEGIAEGILKGAGNVNSAILDLSDKSLKSLKTSMAENITKLSDSIKGQMDIFSKFDIGEVMSPDDLLNNMQSQIDGVTKWASQMETLAARGIDQGLLQKLGDMGPQRAKYVEAFSQMSNEQLMRANMLFAQSAAVPMSAAGQVMGSYAQAGMMAAQGFQNGMDENAQGAAKSASDMAALALESMKKTLGVHSPSTITAEMGLNVAQGLVNGMGAGISSLLSAADRMGSAVVDGVRNRLDLAQWTDIGSSMPASLAKGTVEGLMANIAPAIEAVKTKLTEMNTFLVELFSPAWEMAWMGVESTFKRVFEALPQTLIPPFNAVIATLNAAIAGINNALGSIVIPDWVPEYGGKTFALNIPEIPKLAKGGFTKGLSLAGEAGTEAVISFERSERAANLSYWARAGKMLGADGQTMDMLTNNTTVNKPNKITFAPQITINGDAKRDDAIQVLREAIEEFRDLLEEMGVDFDPSFGRGMSYA